MSQSLSSLQPFSDTFTGSPPSSTAAMSSPSSSPPVQSGTPGGQGAQGQPSPEQILWMGLESDPHQIIFAGALTAVLCAALMTLIWTETAQYYRFFHNRDHIAAQVLVAIGTSLITACFAINVAQVQKLSHHFQDYYTVMRFDMYACAVIELIGALGCFAAGSVFSWRAYILSGRKIWLAPVLGLLNITSFVMILVAGIKNCQVPVIDLNDLNPLWQHFMNIGTFSKISGITTVACDGLICLICLTMLWHSKDSLFNTEPLLIRRLGALVFESMLPPVILIMILAISSSSGGSPMANWRRIVFCLVPPFYYHSLLLALVSRHRIRHLLEKKLAARGIEMKTSSHSFNTGRVYVSAPPPQDTYAQIRGDDLEKQMSPVSPFSPR